MISLSEALSVIDPALRGRARVDAFYSLTWLPITNGSANVPATVTTQDDSDFVPLRMKAYVTSTAVPPVENATPQLTLTLQIGAVMLMPDTNGIEVATFTCSAAQRRGHDFAYPMLISRNTTLTGFLTNLAGADQSVRIFLEGIRILSYRAGT